MQDRFKFVDFERLFVQASSDFSQKKRIANLQYKFAEFLFCCYLKLYVDENKNELKVIINKALEKSNHFKQFVSIKVLDLFLNSLQKI